jgi:hypothetical protein
MGACHLCACIGAVGCSHPRTPCIGSSCAGVGRCSPPRTPCIGSSSAGAGRCSPPPHSLQSLLRRWCGQIPSPPHSLHLLLMRWCRQMPPPPALLACVPLALVLAEVAPVQFHVFGVDDRPRRQEGLLGRRRGALEGQKGTPCICSLALVREDARPPALLASAPPALVRADARPPAIHAITPFCLPPLLDCGQVRWKTPVKGSIRSAPTPSPASHGT